MKCLLLECRPSDQEVDFLLKLEKRVVSAHVRMYVRIYILNHKVVYIMFDSHLYVV